MRRPITRESLLATRPHRHSVEKEVLESVTTEHHQWLHVCSCGAQRIASVDMKTARVSKGSWT